MALVSSYAEIGSISDNTPNYDELMTEHAPFVKRIAYHMITRLPASVQLEDIVQTGMIGLFEALKGYDMSKGASFETYARIRIQGAMIDEVRRCDWTPRSVYKKSRQLSEAIRSIESEQGRDAKDNEVAARLELSMDEYYSMVKDAAGCKLLSYEDIVATGGCEDEYESSERLDPYSHLQKDSFKQGLAEKISSLPEREKMVMALYYDEELNLREIGEVLGITEGRVCQVHGQALLRLRARMTEWVDKDS
ncbi:RNA polymerase sigma factor for flagellar operon [hydrothermal vent metagenome]|uniref:RNA polymerase sigma factor for flagellar operon n=1 Tax=hydrothermal vent metagenome TaxID=652676 RepID=A0A3B0WPJ3_9ZZZZ